MAESTILLQGGTLLVHDETDYVSPLRNTDILIQGNRIAKVAQGITPPAGAEVVDCTGKIVSPGLVDTHHHLWQTQLKGCHAEHSLFDYMTEGAWQSHVYEPSDTYWGQLGGALEAINAGTTFVLDHAHGNRTKEHASQALSATIASGIRSIFAYADTTCFTRWDLEACDLSRNLLSESFVSHMVELAKSQPHGEGRVHIGCGFDYWFLPQPVVVGLFSRLREAGVKLFTTHYCYNPVTGAVPVPQLLKSYDLLKSPSDMVVSHATGISAGEIAALAEHQIPVSVTPDTEAQMGFSWSLCFRPGLKTTLGVDCHSSSTSSILSLARAASHMARQRDAVAETKDGQGEGAPAHMHLTPSGSTQEAFNAATINGARAVLLGDQIGSIKEGKLADLVIFDAPGSLSMSCVAESDPLVAVVRHSDVRDIEGVIVDGKWRKKDGQICPVAIAESGKELRWPGIRDELLRSQRDIQQRQKGLNLAKAKEAIIGMFHIDKNSLIQ